MHRVRIAVLIAAGCIAGFSPAIAQTRKPDAAIVAEMERYRLTLADARKVVQAGKNIDANPAAARAMATLAPSGQNGAKELERILQSNADITKSLRDAGLTVTEFLTITTVWLAVGFADLMPQKEALDMLRDAHVHPDNLTFYRQNKEALNALR